MTVKIVKTIEKYDENGNLIEKIIKEKTKEKSEKYTYAPLPYYPPRYWEFTKPTCDNRTGTADFSHLTITC